MSWWRKIIDPPGASSAIGFPVEAELIPGQLGARIYLHDVDTRDGVARCWTYVSSGLVARDQKEIVFTLRCAPGEPPGAYPNAPCEFLLEVWRLAGDGKVVDVGGVSQFSDARLFGRHLTYIQTERLRGMPLPDGTITAVLVTEDELTAVREFGLTRVAARLGWANRYYPCPPWSDRAREGISFAPARAQSILVRVCCIHAPGVSVVRSERRLEIRVASRSIGRMAARLNQLNPKLPIALLTALDAAANACLVWRPGVSGPEAISPEGSDGSRLCGCFVLFAPGQAQDAMNIIEDGFGLLLRDVSWLAIRHALMSGDPVEVPLTGAPMSVAVKCLDDRATVH